MLGITPEIADQILEELAKPDQEVLRFIPRKNPLDEIEAQSFMAKYRLLDGEAESIILNEGDLDLDEKEVDFSLDGTWLLIEGDGQEPSWEEAIPAQVPGSVHTALVKNGRIPNPVFGQNQRIARKESYKTWCYKRNFPRPMDQTYV